jgi:GNAT superfamily N-acetyltransferase
MKITSPTVEDLSEILNMVSKITEKMQSQGNFQWDDNYPTPEILLKDIQEGTLFTANHNDNIIGILALTYKEEVQYKDITWNDKDGKAIEIHRMGVLPSCQGKGIGRKLFEFTEEFAQKNGYSSIRLDTYCANDRMIKLIELMGYIKTGDIFFPPLTPPFYCYEKIL